MSSWEELATCFDACQSDATEKHFQNDRVGPALQGSPIAQNRGDCHSIRLIWLLVSLPVFGSHYFSHYLGARDFGTWLQGLDLSTFVLTGPHPSVKVSFGAGGVPEVRGDEKAITAIGRGDLWFISRANQGTFRMA